MITTLATTIYNTLTTSLSGQTENIYYKYLPEYTDFGYVQVYYDITGSDFPETLDNHKLNMFKLVVTVLVKPEIESQLYDIERSIKNGFSTLSDTHVKDVHIANAPKTYNELLDVIEKKINIDLTYVE